MSRYILDEVEALLDLLHLLLKGRKESAKLIELADVERLMGNDVGDSDFSLHVLVAARCHLRKQLS